jgi:hypothetical protein
VREVRPPFAPSRVVADFSATLRAYGCERVYGDRYAGEWPREAFAKHGVEYVVAKRTRSDFYVAFLPLLNSQAVELLDHGRLLMQLRGLERRATVGGRDAVDHGRAGHDDVINAAAGALVLAHEEATRPALVIT